MNTNTMSERFTHLAIIVALCCILFAGCRTGESASPGVLATPESVAKRVEQLNLQHERIEQLASRWPHGSTDFLESIHAGRVAWTNYLRAVKDQHAIFAANGIALDGEYYRLQEKLLEALSLQWQQIEDLLAKTP